MKKKFFWVFQPKGGQVALSHKTQPINHSAIFIHLFKGERKYWILFISSLSSSSSLSSVCTMSMCFSGKRQVVLVIFFCSNSHASFEACTVIHLAAIMGNITSLVFLGNVSTTIHRRLRRRLGLHEAKNLMRSILFFTYRFCLRNLHMFSAMLWTTRFTLKGSRLWSHLPGGMTNVRNTSGHPRATPRTGGLTSRLMFDTPFMKTTLSLSKVWVVDLQGILCNCQTSSSCHGTGRPDFGAIQPSCSSRSGRSSDTEHLMSMDLAEMPCTPITFTIRVKSCPLEAQMSHWRDCGWIPTARLAVILEPTVIASSTCKGVMMESPALSATFTSCPTSPLFAMVEV